MIRATYLIPKTPYAKSLRGLRFSLRAAPLLSGPSRPCLSAPSVWTPSVGLFLSGASLSGPCLFTFCLRLAYVFLRQTSPGQTGLDKTGQDRAGLVPFCLRFSLRGILTWLTCCLTWGPVSSTIKM